MTPGQTTASSAAFPPAICIKRRTRQIRDQTAAAPTTPRPPVTGEIVSGATRHASVTHRRLPEQLCTRRLGLGVTEAGHRMARKFEPRSYARHCRSRHRAVTASNSLTYQRPRRRLPRKSMQIGGVTGRAPVPRRHSVQRQPAVGGDSARSERCSRPLARAAPGGSARAAWAMEKRGFCQPGGVGAA